MRLRHRLFLSFSLALLASLLVMLLLQSFTGQNERMARAYSLIAMQARDMAQLRGAAEDGLVDPSVYAQRIAGLGSGVTAWVVGGNGIILPADPPMSGPAQVTGQIERPDVVSPFSAEGIERYVAPALRGESQIVTGEMDGRLARTSVTAIEPIPREGGIRAALFLHRPIEDLERGDIFILWRQSALAALGAAAVGLVLVWWRSVRAARPYEALAARDEEDEAASLRREIDGMRAQIEDLEMLRKGFLSNVSHELRSPLTNVIGYLQGLADGAVGEQDRERFTLVALDEARRMSALIGDLLDLSRLESGRFELHIERFDIAELVRRALVACANAIDEKHIRLALDIREEAIFVRADSLWIRQAIDNILGNAIKFVHEGGNLVVRVHALADRAYVTIADDGPGIAPEDQKHVFEWFYKADKAHSTAGTGLGLAIARSVLDRHGQAVRLSSQPGRGTIVSFSLALDDR